MLLKAVLVGLLMAVAEVINGNIRVRLLHKRLGKKRAKLISFVSGTLLIYIICWWLLPWINPVAIEHCLAIGLLWFFILLTLDLYFARFVFRASWKNIRNDFNPVSGNMLSIGLLLLFLSPLIVFSLRLV